MSGSGARKCALITGVTGQDGAYLAQLLLDQGYEVHGIKRRSSSFNTGRIEDIYQDPHDPDQRFALHYGDMTDATNLIRIVQEVRHGQVDGHQHLPLDQRHRRRPGPEVDAAGEDEAADDADDVEQHLHDVDAQAATLERGNQRPRHVTMDRKLRGRSVHRKETLPAAAQQTAFRGESQEKTTQLHVGCPIAGQLFRLVD